MRLAELQNRLIEKLQPEFKEWEQATGIKVHSFKVGGYNAQGEFLGAFYVSKNMNAIIKEQQYHRVCLHCATDFVTTEETQRLCNKHRIAGFAKRRSGD